MKRAERLEVAELVDARTVPVVNNFKRVVKREVKEVFKAATSDWKRDVKKAVKEAVDEAFFERLGLRDRKVDLKMMEGKIDSHQQHQQSLLICTSAPTHTSYCCTSASSFEDNNRRMAGEIDTLVKSSPVAALRDLGIHVVGAGSVSVDDAVNPHRQTTTTWTYLQHDDLKMAVSCADGALKYETTQCDDSSVFVELPPSLVNQVTWVGLLEDHRFGAAQAANRPDNENICVVVLNKFPRHIVEENVPHWNKETLDLRFLRHASIGGLTLLGSVTGSHACSQDDRNDSFHFKLNGTAEQTQESGALMFDVNSPPELDPIPLGPYLGVTVPDADTDSMPRGRICRLPPFDAFQWHRKVAPPPANSFLELQIDDVKRTINTDQLDAELPRHICAYPKVFNLTNPTEPIHGVFIEKDCTLDE